MRSPNGVAGSFASSALSIRSSASVLGSRRICNCARAMVKAAPSRVLAARVQHVEIEARKPLLVRDGAGAQGCRQEGKLVPPIVGVGPDQGLRSRGLENVLGAAIGEGMEGEAVAMPDERSARPFGAHQQIGEHHVDAEGKTGNRLAGPGQGDAGNRLMPVHRGEFFVDVLGQRSTNGPSPRRPGQETASAAHKARSGWNNS